MAMTNYDLSQIPSAILVAVAAIGSLWLFILVKTDLRRAARRREQDRKEILDACNKIQETIDEMRRRPSPAAPAEAPLSGPAATLSRRAQILRMSRRGDRPEQIAAVLGTPVSEVILVLKMTSLQQTNAASA